MKNKSNQRRFSAREEVINETINAVRKRIIQIQLETEFAYKFIDANPGVGTEEAKAQLIQNIDIMKKEEMALVAKLDFYKEKRNDIIAKKVMKGYDKFPETISLEDAQIVE